MNHTADNLLSQEKGSTIRLWQMSNSGYQQTNELQTEHFGFCRMEYIPERQLIVNAKDSNDIGLYERNTLKLELLLQLESGTTNDGLSNLGSIMCVRCINLSGQTYILAGYESGDFLTWDLRCSKVINRVKLEPEGPLSIDYDPITNRGVYAGSTDNIGVFNYNKSTMELIKKTDIKIKNQGVNCVKIRNDRKVFTAGGWDGKVRIFSWKSLRPLAVLTDHKDAIMDIQYSNEKVTLYKSAIMAAAGKDGQISLWDIYN